MVFVNSGIGAQLVSGVETTWGVAASLSTSPAPYFFEFNSETLELKKTVVQGQGLHAGGLYNRGARRVVTEYGVSGAINGDLPTRYLHPLLNQMLGASAVLATDSGDTGAYIATYYPGSVKGKSLTFQKGVPQVDGSATIPFTYTGCKFTDWTISVATGAIATLALTVDGYGELTPSGGIATNPLNASAPALATWAEAANNNVFHFREANLIAGGTLSGGVGSTTVSGGTTLGMVHSAEIKHALSLDTTRYFLGGNGYKAEQIENNWRNTTGQFVVDWNTAALATGGIYAAFTGDTPVTLQLKFVATDSIASTLSILLPQVFLEGETPKVGGPQVVQQTVAFTANDDGTHDPINMTYVTADSA